MNGYPYGTSVDTILALRKLIEVAEERLEETETADGYDVELRQAIAQTHSLLISLGGY